jgi:hypothetical protein
MESVIRDVKSIELNERQLYESVLGHALQESQRVIIRVIELESNDPGEADRRAALGRAVEIARQGRASVEAQGITAKEADATIDEAIENVRRPKH